MKQAKQASLQIWLVRHGQTEGNKLQILQGQDGGELSALGVKQAEALGKRLKNEQFDRVYVSDLARTLQTFEQIKKVHVKPMAMVPEPLLREKHAGVLQGKSLNLPRQLAQEQKVDIRVFRPEQGESWEDVNMRAQQMLEKIKAECGGLQRILLVTHGGFIMEFLNHVNYVISKKPPVYNNAAMNCSISIVQCSPSGLKIVLQNDVSHLQKL